MTCLLSNNWDVVALVPNKPRPSQGFVYTPTHKGTQVMQAVSSFLATLQVRTPVKIRQKRQLERWRALCMRRWVYREANICQILQPSSKCQYGERGHHLQSPNVVADLDSQPLLYASISSILRSSPPTLLAELREWQKAAHILACIDTTIQFISQRSSTPDPLTDLIDAAMFSTISSLLLSSSPSPSHFFQPAQPHPDDQAVITSRRVFSDEPQMQTLLSCLDAPNFRALEEAAERERARLPLFPACFREEAAKS